MNTKINFAAGIMNIVSAVALAVNAVITLLCLIVCIVMPVLLPIWFLPFIFFIPVMGFVFAISLAAAVCNLVAGVGTVVASTRGGKASRVFAVISLAVDGLFIPVNALFFGYGVIGMSEVNWLTVLIVIASSAAIALTVVSIVLNTVCLCRGNTYQMRN